MPKNLNYTDDQLCLLANILIEKSEDRLVEHRGNLKICDEKYTERTNRRIANLEKRIAKMKKAMSVFKGEDNSLKSRVRDYVSSKFDKLYPPGNIDRGRITARIRKKINYKVKARPEPGTISQKTKKALRLLGKKDPFKGSSFDQIISILINRYSSSNAKEQAIKNQKGDPQSTSDF